MKGNAVFIGLVANIIVLRTNGKHLPHYYTVRPSVKDKYCNFSLILPIMQHSASSLIDITAALLRFR